MSHNISNSNINSSAAPKLTAIKSKAQTNITKVDSDGFGKQALVKHDGFESKIKGLDTAAIERKAFNLTRLQAATKELGPDLYQANNQATDGAPPPIIFDKPMRLARLNDENERYKSKTQGITRTHFDTQV